MKCLNCGKEFVPVRSTQKYCCSACRRHAARQGLNDAMRVDASPDVPAIREFRCITCGKLVRVTDSRDCRTKFCSHRCEKTYWKHSENVTSAAVYREFVCCECGKHVAITDPLDKRRRFCSAACRIRWYNAKKGKLYGQQKQRKENSV